MDMVIAVVVTYDRLELLTQCIDALRNQNRKPDQILIVNNGSTDETDTWLKTQSDLIFISQDNLGSGGGFNTGIKYAYDNGYSWIWMMDDDGYPDENALKHLLEDDTDEMILRNCAVINKFDRKSFVWRTKHYKTIDEVETAVIDNVAHPFNGTLIHRKIVERVGLPKTKLFVWGDESEYMRRIINLNGIPYKTYSKSIHYHPPAGYHYKLDYNYVSSWKMYYYIRNRFLILKSQFHNMVPLAFIMYLLFLCVFAARVLIFQKSKKIAKLSFIAWPVIDAFSMNYDATPDFIIERMKRKPSFSLNSIENYFSNLRGELAGENFTVNFQESKKAEAI